MKIVTGQYTEFREYDRRPGLSEVQGTREAPDAVNVHINSTSKERINTHTM